MGQLARPAAIAHRVTMSEAWNRKLSEPAKLGVKRVEKPWGRSELPAIFDSAGSARIGEIWFEAPEGVEPPLLVKYIFTSERLSIQVHPNDEQARARGEPNGKSECWYILDAEPGAELGIGLTREVSPDELRAAALDGSIEQLIDWKPVTAGDFFYVPAGTVHAIGGGLTLIEVQQISEATYRLYDYGRPRELHLEDAIAVARRSPYAAENRQHVSGGSCILVSGPHFLLLRLDGSNALADRLGDRDRMAIPLHGRLRCGGANAGAGECLFVPAGAEIAAESECAFLLAAKGSLEG